IHATKMLRSLVFCHILYRAQMIPSNRIKPWEKTIGNQQSNTLLGLSSQFLLPLNLKVSGLEFIPAERPLESLGSMDETLEIFHWILSSLPVDDVTQILWDIENLRALLQTLATTMGCELHQTTELETLKDLAKEHSTSPYTTEKVALDRLQKCLLTMVKELEQIKDC
uniref:Leptin n=1 Tax=Latimeria chalumnae TaxID=7897 RepID=H3AP28_LATCH